MFQFFIIKNGLQLIHSFAAISWNPITIKAETTSDADSQATGKKYRCISNALIFPSGKCRSFVYTVWELSTKLCRTKSYMDSYTGSGLLSGAGFFLFQRALIRHWPRHHVTTSPKQKSFHHGREFAPGLLLQKNPQIRLSPGALIFQVKPVLTSPPIFFRNSMG